MNMTNKNLSSHSRLVTSRGSHEEAGMSASSGSGVRLIGVRLDETAVPSMFGSPADPR